MKKQDVELMDIEGKRRIDRKEDSKFLYLMQTALLLSLKERGRLNEIQYRQAEQLLMQQWGQGGPA